ncbi:sigma-54-dependent Fis family transcriptional regulator, partial [Acidobacteria bacterium ACD]|nr:sigma-54-dependent Fis family transcriptional regulator [Acidobacteria bacterium ACD]
LPAPVPVPAPPAAVAGPGPAQLVTMADHERAALSEALKVVGGNVRAAADRLQLARSTLYRRMKALGIRETG